MELNRTDENNLLFDVKSSHIWIQKYLTWKNPEHSNTAHLVHTVADLLLWQERRGGVFVRLHNVRWVICAEQKPGCVGSCNVRTQSVSMKGDGACGETLCVCRLYITAGLWARVNTFSYIKAEACFIKHIFNIKHTAWSFTLLHRIQKLCDDPSSEAYFHLYIENKSVRGTWKYISSFIEWVAHATGCEGGSWCSVVCPSVVIYNSRWCFRSAAVQPRLNMRLNSWNVKSLCLSERLPSRPGLL